MSIEASIVICTYNRAAYLRDALHSLAVAPGPDPAALEVVVVDNNCSDDTRQVVAAAAAASPVPVRFVRETRQGLSHARNRGCLEAGGRFLAYMDDDQLADAGYCAGLLAHCRSTQAACFGGKIRFLDYETAPGWLKLQTRFIGQLDFGDQPVRISETTRKLKGGNFVIRRDVLTELGGFDPALGIQGKVFFSGEEDAIQSELLRRGYEVCYYPDLVQWNRYTDEQRRKGYWRRRSFQHGRAMFTRHPENWTGRRVVLGAPGWLYRALATRLWIYARSLAGADEADRFNRETEIWENLGLIWEARRRRAARR